MVHLQNRLLFPRLIQIGTCELSRGSRKVPKYFLDWEPLNRLKIEKFHSWLKTTSYDEISLIPTAVDPDLHYDFALNQDVFNEVQRLSRTALAVWDQSYCRNLFKSWKVVQLAAEELVWAALWLLADCAYDMKTRFFLRGADKIVLVHEMAWRFWQYQAGIDRMWDLARMKELVERYRIDKIKIVRLNDDYEKEVSAYVEKATTHLEELYTSFLEIVKAGDDEIVIASSISDDLANWVHGCMVKRL